MNLDQDRRGSRSTLDSKHADDGLNNTGASEMYELQQSVSRKGNGEDERGIPLAEDIKRSATGERIPDLHVKGNIEDAEGQEEELARLSTVKLVVLAVLMLFTFFMGVSEPSR